jgi:hypothetical protein
MSEDRNLGTATVADAIEMLRTGGVDLQGELSNIRSAYIDISDELEAAGYTEIGFNSDDLAAAIRAEIA